MTPAPLLLVTPDQRASWEALLRGQGRQTISALDLPDPVEDPSGALARLDELTRGCREPSLDPVTGLLDRCSSLEELALRFNVSSGTRWWLALANIDNYQRINDNFGPVVGEEMLVEWGRITREAFPEAPVRGRLARDTLILALEGAPGVVRNRLEAWRESLRTTPFSQRFILTLSVGLAKVRTGESLESLYSRCERHLFAAKNRGRNRIVDEEDFSQGVGSSALDEELADFENRLSVFTDRLLAGNPARGLPLREGPDSGDTDPVTGLFQRSYFERRWAREQERSRRLNSPLALVFVSLEAPGEAPGPLDPQVLEACGHRLLQSIRVVDWAARFHGNEFFAVFPDTTRAVALAVAERIRSGLETLVFPLGNGLVRVKATFGVAAEPHTGAVSTLVQRVVAAVRHAPSRGGIRVVEAEA